MIGDDIEVKVLKIKGNKVHVGISASSDVRVHRKEVWLQLQDVAETKRT
jgi:carbon storage regulator